MLISSGFHLPSDIYQHLNSFTDDETATLQNPSQFHCGTVLFNSFFHLTVLIYYCFRYIFNSKNLWKTRDYVLFPISVFYISKFHLFITFIWWDNHPVSLGLLLLLLLHSCPLNTGLNCEGPFICGFFSIGNTTVLHSLQLVESKDVEPRVWGTQDTEELWIWGQTISYMRIFNCVKGGCP